MTIIADAGSTKTTWAITDSNDGSTIMARTSGLNPAVMTPDAITGIIAAELLPVLPSDTVEAIYYYGAGVVTDLHRDTIRSALSAIHCQTIVVESDMLGAARSLLGHKPGIAGILGTGSNSCLYDGSQIVSSIPPLGYILGDEGSGASIGKRFVADLFKGLLPAEVIELWQDDNALSMGEVIERVYRRPGANRFLASLMPLIKKASRIEAVSDLIRDEFDRYFTRNIDRYGRPDLPLGFTGSVAHHFSPWLRSVAAAHRHPLPAICPDPMPGLIAYHADAKKI
ncbi:MAG: ATPase [Bacteroidales bacterium]|nr:ATPase [Bacteroidales bacterium]